MQLIHQPVKTVSIAILALALIAGAADARPDYAACVWGPDGRVTVLPTPAGYASEAFGINDAGHVVGRINGPLDGVSELQAVVWRRDGNSYTRQAIPDINGAGPVDAVDINNDNWLVGQFYRPGAGNGVFCYNTGSGAVREVPFHGTYGSGTTASMYARAISETGWVAGTYAPGDPYFGYTWHGFRYDAYNQTAFADVGTLTDDFYGQSSSYAVDNTGLTVGRSHYAAGSNRGFVFDGGALALIDSIDWAAAITDNTGYVVGHQNNPDDGNTYIRIVKLEGPGAGVETLSLPAGISAMSAMDLNNHLDVLALPYGGGNGYWYDYSAGTWHELGALMPGNRSIVQAMSDTGLIAGHIEHDRNQPLPLAGGGGSIVYKPTGFMDEGFVTVGMTDGAKPLDQIIELDDLSFVPDEQGKDMVNLVINYDEAEVLAAGIDESTLRLYWFDEDAGEWALAGRTSNHDQTTGSLVMGPATNLLGDWGVDTQANNVWANIDHASVYAISGVPEPISLMLLGAGGLWLTRRRNSG
jgi:uncharacterized membrane protein